MLCARRDTRGRTVLRAALAAYSLLIALILGWPTQSTPVVGTLDLVGRWLRDRGAPDWLGGATLEFVANIALFVPFGLLATLVLSLPPSRSPGRPRWWLPVLAGFGFSLGAEVAQAALLPQRFGTVNDVVANTAGTALGVGVAWALTRWRSGQGPR